MNPLKTDKFKELMEIDSENIIEYYNDKILNLQQKMYNELQEITDMYYKKIYAIRDDALTVIDKLRNDLNVELEKTKKKYLNEIEEEQNTLNKLKGGGFDESLPEKKE